MRGRAVRLRPVWRRGRAVPHGRVFLRAALRRGAVRASAVSGARRRRCVVGVSGLAFMAGLSDATAGHAVAKVGMAGVASVRVLFDAAGMRGVVSATGVNSLAGVSRGI